jgi:hypothetical protein
MKFTFLASPFDIYLSDKRGSSKSILQLVFSQESSIEMFTFLASPFDIDLSDKRGSSKSISQLVFSEESSIKMLTFFATVSPFWSVFSPLISTRSLALPHSTTYKPAITPMAPIKLKIKPYYWILVDLQK